MQTDKKPVLVIFAPTATGKTELLFRLFGAQAPLVKNKKARVISADSMQVYRGLDICTAKPSQEELKNLEHCLIDIKNPDEQFSAAEFTERADALCDSFHEQNILPVIAGGTGFYIRSFLLGLPSTPEGSQKVRAELKAEAEEKGAKAMWHKLSELDGESALKINPNDLYRILRALEIYELTGKPRREFAQKPFLRKKYDFRILILKRQREDLYRRIEERVDRMFEAGLEAEVKKLAEKYSPECPGLKAIGCREFFEGGTPSQTAERIKHNSKKYAKKQYVFMKGIPEARIISILPDEDFTGKVLDNINDFL